MSRWKRRDPAIFPVHFADTVEVAFRDDVQGTPILLHVAKSASDARQYLDKFREWRFCLRERGTPSHRCFYIERDKVIRTSTVEALGVYSIYVRVEDSPMAVMLRNNPDVATIGQ